MLLFLYKCSVITYFNAVSEIPDSKISIKNWKWYCGIGHTYRVTEEIKDFNQDLVKTVNPDLFRG